ncbi:MAG: UDP-N-acetylglucosamine 1-carboxyvinyltransferase [Bacteroidia bacterium]
MAAFRVVGGKPLQGTYTPQGAKNEALQVLSAALLTPETITYHNVPAIADVQQQLQLIQLLGAQVTYLSPTSLQIQAQEVYPERLLEPDVQKKFQRLRGSILLAGPLLARQKEVWISRPGGDKIGRRRIDTHLLGFQKLGATIQYEPKTGLYHIVAPQLIGNEVLLDEASVTGTANLIMASMGAQGKTQIYHAACEPYIQQLCRLLIQMGAQIGPIGSNLLTVEGPVTCGATHTLEADMIEIGSIIGLGAMCGGQIRIPHVQPKALGLIPYAFERLGVDLSFDPDGLRVRGDKVCQIHNDWDGSILTLSDHPWPGIPADLLSILLVVATQCEGEVLIHQKMFESRLFFVDKLIEMGARVVLCDPHRALVLGLGRRSALRGIRLSSPDIRAGIALLIAALSATGESIIENIEQIDRGYMQVDQRLAALGAQVERL